MNKYYKVVAKCGHVKREYYIPIAFAVIARSGKEAAKATREFPRVKHDHSDAILSCDEITYEEYLMLCEENEHDPYLKCENRQQQENIEGLESRLVHDSHVDNIVYGTSHKEKVERNKIRNRSLSKSYRYNNDIILDNHNEEDDLSYLNYMSDDVSFGTMIL